MPRQKRAREDDPETPDGDVQITDPGPRRSKRARTAPAAPAPVPAPPPARSRKAAPKSKSTQNESGSKAKAPARAKGGRKKKTEATPAQEADVQAATAPPAAGPSQPTATVAAAAAPSRSKPKKRASGSATTRAPTEKRLAPFRSSPSSETIARRERALKQRFFMIDRERNGTELKETFSILGSTQNVYTVVIDHKPRCDCPDARWGHHCKHIMFVYFRVLQVPESSNLWYQKALLTSELETIFNNAPLAPNSLAHDRIRNAFNEATGKAPAPAKEGDSSSATKNDKRRIPGPDDDCPICYETMYQVQESKLAFCHSCGNALHSACFDQWKGSNAFRHTPLTCVWCRAPWAAPKPAMGNATSDPRAFYSHTSGVDLGGGVRRTYNGYLNLAGVVNGT